MHIYVYIHAINTHVHICVQACMYACNVCMYACMSACMYACMNVLVHAMYTHIRVPGTSKCTILVCVYESIDNLSSRALKISVFPVY